MLWVLKRTIFMRRFFRTPKTYVKTDGLENIDNFTLKNFVSQPKHILWVLKRTVLMRRFF